jgi:alpha-galactosidase
VRRDAGAGAEVRGTLNRNADSRKIVFDWRAEKVNDELFKHDAAFATTSYRMRNLWNGRFVGNTARTLTTDLPGHDVLVLRLTRSR